MSLVSGAAWVLAPAAACGALGYVLGRRARHVPRPEPAPAVPMEAEAAAESLPEAGAEAVRDLLAAVAGIATSLNEQRIIEATLAAVSGPLAAARVTLHMHERKSDRILPGRSLPGPVDGVAVDQNEPLLRQVIRLRQALFRHDAPEAAADAFHQAEADVAAVLPLFDRAMLAGFLVVHGPLAPEAPERLQIVAAACGLALSGARLAARCESQSRTDPLTGLWMADAVRDEVERAIARGPLAVVLLAADHLRRVNESYGRKAGDRALAALAKLLPLEVGSEGVVGRYGGASMLVVLPGYRGEAARALAERIQRRVRRSIMAGPEGLASPLTVCAGVAACSVGTGDMLLQAAEQALGTAQRRGTDQLEVVGIAEGVHA